MPRPAKPIAPPRDAEPWLYEILRSLGASSISQASGLASIARGEVPDGSGSPLVNLDQYFFLSGRNPGQVASGANTDAGSLTLSSTSKTSKGKIYFGSTGAYDETAALLGLNTLTPASHVEIRTGSTQFTTTWYPPTSNPSGILAWTGSDGGTTNLWTYIDETTTDDTDYIKSTNSTPSGISFRTGAITPVANTAIVYIIFRASWSGSNGGNNGLAMNYIVSDGLGTSLSPFYIYGGVAGPNWVAINASGSVAVRDYIYQLTPAQIDTLNATPTRWNFFTVSLNIGNAGLNYSGECQITRLGVSVISTVNTPKLLTAYDLSGNLKATVTPTGCFTLAADGANGQTENPLQITSVLGTILGGITPLGAPFFVTGAAAGSYLATTSTAGVAAWTARTALSVGTPDTNVIITLGGAPTTALFTAASITMSWSGTLAATRGGTGTGTYALGDLLYSSATNTLAKLAGNIVATRKFLRQTGTGTISAAPVWDTLLATDISNVMTLDTVQTVTEFKTFAGLDGASGSSMNIRVNTNSGFLGTGLILNNGSGFVAEIQINNLTADRTYIFPDATGTLVLTGLEVNLILGTGTTLKTNTSTVGASFQDTTTTSIRLRFVLSGSVGANSITLTNTAARNYTFGDTNGSVVLVGNTTSASGVLGKIVLTGQTASLAAQTMLTGNTVSAGAYRLSFYFTTTTIGDVADNVTLTLAWNDGAAHTMVIGFLGTTSNILPYTAHDLRTANAFSEATAVVRVAASTDITFTTTLTSPGAGTPAYSIDARIEALG